MKVEFLIKVIMERDFYNDSVEKMKKDILQELTLTAGIEAINFEKEVKK